MNLLIEKGSLMDIDIIFKIAGIGIAIAVLNQVLVKAGREEQAKIGRASCRERV